MCGPYCKLWTKFFPLPCGPSMKRTGHKKRGERESITYGTDQANEVNKMFIIWL